MFVFADETGNSGKNVFDKNEWYRLGAILSVSDVEAELRSVIQPVINAQGMARAHGHEMPALAAAKLANDIMDELDRAGPWSFFTFSIHKPYVVTTKFVDLIFDAGENLAVPHTWYNIELFRHAICLAVDDCMTPLNRARFWDAFLKDDVPGIQACVRNLLVYVIRKVGDPRLREIVRDALQFALKHPEQFTLLAAHRRDSYQGHTPNMVAFTALFDTIHRFAEEHASPPIAFIHDQQQEFKRAMREAYRLFGGVRKVDHPLGEMPDIARVTYNLAKFDMPSSKDSFALQATDVLLWLIQRADTRPELAAATRRLRAQELSNLISRPTSELIVRARYVQSMRLPLDDTKLSRAAELRDRLDSNRRDAVARLEAEKREQLTATLAGRST